ncbi:MAG: DUF4476 domain-containing protein [Siphonobacter sp.]
MKTIFLTSCLCLLAAYHPAFADVEFFLQMPAGSPVTVVVNDQSITNSTGRFRFFDLYPGRAQVMILRGNTTLLRQWVNLSSNARVVAEYYPQMGFRVRGVYPLNQNNSTTEPVWGQGQQPYANQQNTPSQRFIPERNQYDRNRIQPEENTDDDMPPISSRSNSSSSVEKDQSTENDQPMTDDQMEQYMLAIKRVTSDNRVAFLEKTLPRQHFNSDQLVEILKTLTNTNDKLRIAQIGWDHVSDQENFEIIYNLFSFESDKQSLRDYCESHQ